MHLRVVYCNHQTAELAVREKLAFPSPETLGRAYAALQAQLPDTECVLLSTCNRVEVYLAQEKVNDAPSLQQIARFFSEFHQIPLDDFLNDLREQSGPAAVRHLFEVVSSIDSMVVGEPQIVSQVKEAYQCAQVHNACGRLTNALFQAAIRVSGRIRTETRLSEGRVSIASVAVGEFGKSIFDRFDDKTVLVIGAGEMAEETLRYLKDEGVRDILVCNRSRERAERVAAAWGGVIKPFDELDRWMGQADVIVSTTGASQPIVTAERFRKVRAEYGAKPVFILDLGAPRDFDPQVADVDDNVFLNDIDSLEATCEANRKKRSTEIEKARELIGEETSRFMHDVYYQATGPIIQQLRDEWHEVRAQEVERLRNKLPHLAERDFAEVEKSIERIINKLLHPPLKTLKDEAKDGTPHGLLTALKQLFHLE